MRPAVEVTRVDVRHDLPGLAGWHLDAPQEGAVTERYALGLSGWLLAADGAPQSIEARAGHDVLRRVAVGGQRPDLAAAHPGIDRAGVSGFTMTVDLLELPPEFRFELAALSPGGADVPLGTVSGHRAPLPGPPAGHLNPIMISGLGRSGTQWLVRLIGQHPEVVAYRPFDYEPGALVYWASVLRAVAAPASQSELLVRSVFDRRFWLGDSGASERIHYADPGVLAELGRTAVDELAAFAQWRVESFYRAAAQTGEGGAPLFFVEKLGRMWPLSRLVLELYPAGKEIVLIRDFRDSLASVLARNAKLGFMSFGRELVDSDQEFVTHYAGLIDGLRRHYRPRRAEARLVRYEDLILEPERTLAALLAWLGAESGSGTVRDMLASAGRETPQMRAHRTSPSAPESIGRWKHDLPPELRDRSTELFAEALADFGYEV